MDISSRVIAQKLQEALGQPVVVELKPGAGGVIAAEYVARSAPDGYTLLMGPSGPMTINPATYSKLSYSPTRDFAPISMIGSGKSKELMDRAKELGCDCVIFDNELSPGQQRAWEDESGLCVIDRQGNKLKTIHLAEVLARS